MASNIPSRKQQASGIMSNPHAGPSQPLQTFRKLRTRRGCAQLRSHYNQPYNASTLSTRLESANKHIEDRSESSLVDSGASRGPNPIETHGFASSEGSWSVMNSKYELHLSDESPDIHLPRACAKISRSPRPSTSVTEHHGSQQTSIGDNRLIPDPLKVGKNSMSWNPAVGKMYQNKSSNKHSMSTAAHSRAPATENTLVQHLFQVKAQIAELRMSLCLCESKLSQMTDELSEMKSASDTKYTSKSSQTLSGNNNKPEYPIPAPDLDVTDSKQLALLPSVNATGVSAQQKRGQKAPAI